jgi:hypothetical protein
MAGRRGLIGAATTINRWSHADPNGRLAAAGAAGIVVPFVVGFAVILALELFPLPEDPQQSFHWGKYDAGFFISWSFIVTRPIFFLSLLVGLILLIFASWRALRNRRRQTVNPPAPKPNAPAESR